MPSRYENKSEFQHNPSNPSKATIQLFTLQGHDNFRYFKVNLTYYTSTIMTPHHHLN